MRVPFDSQSMIEYLFITLCQNYMYTTNVSNITSNNVIISGDEIMAEQPQNVRSVESSACSLQGLMR